MVDFDNSELKRNKTLEAIQNPQCGWFYTANQKDFEKIPGSPIGYWVSEKVFDIYDNNNLLIDYANVKVGLQTGENNRFRRNWSEVEISTSSISNGEKWYPYNSGGDFRKWYGNQNYFVNWENGGFEIRVRSENPVFSNY